VGTRRDFTPALRPRQRGETILAPVMDEDLVELVWWAMACLAMVAYGLLIR
jgi:hypothetical protein